MGHGVSLSVRDLANRASVARTAVVQSRRAGLIAAVAGHARPVSFQQHRLRSLRVLNVLQTSKGKRELKKHSCACACAWRHCAAQPAPRRTLSLTAMGRATSWMPVSHAPAPSSVGAAPPPRGPARSSGGTSYREACVSLPPGPLGSSCPGAAVPRRLASSASMNFSLQFVASCCGRPQVPGCDERVKGGALHSHLGVLLPDHLLLLRAERVSQAQALLLVSRRLHLVGGRVRRRGELSAAFPTHSPLKRRTWGAAAAPSADRAPRRATSRPYGSARHTRGASGSRPALHSRRHKSNTPGTELAPAAADACPPTVACHSERLASAGRGDTRGVGLFSASAPQLVLAGHGLRHLHLVRVVVSLALAVVAPHGAAGWRAFSGGDRQTRAMPSGTSFGRHVPNMSS